MTTFDDEILIYERDSQLLGIACPKYIRDRKKDFSNLVDKNAGILLNKDTGMKHKFHMALYLNDLIEGDFGIIKDGIEWETLENGKKFALEIILNIRNGPCIYHHKKIDGGLSYNKKNEENEGSIELHFSHADKYYTTAFGQKGKLDYFLDDSFLEHVLKPNKRSLVAVVMRKLEDFKFDFCFQVENDLTLQVIGNCFFKKEDSKEKKNISQKYSTM